METNKETRMISSDEIFYAVLKDGTIVNNVKSLLTVDKLDILQSLFMKVLNANVDILQSSKNYTNSEIEALKKKENLWATGALLRCGSPAAEYVSNFHSDKYGIFGLPTLLAAMDLQHQKEDIDALAETIEGAHLLRNFIIYAWSCSRYSEDGGWIASDFGFATGDILCSSYLSIPVVLYR